MIPADYDPQEKVPLATIGLILKNGDRIPIKYWNGSRMIETDFVAQPLVLPIREKYPRYEKVDYEIFGGISVMELAINHFKYFKRLSKFYDIENRFRPQLIITQILPGSEIDHLDIFTPGNLIKSINGIKVSTLDQYREALIRPISNNGQKFIKIINQDDRAIVLNLNELLQQEEQLIKSLDYQPSDLLIKFAMGNNNFPSQPNNLNILVDNDDSTVALALDPPKVQKYGKFGTFQSAGGQKHQECLLL